MCQACTVTLQKDETNYFIFYSSKGKKTWKIKTDNILALKEKNEIMLRIYKYILHSVIAYYLNEITGKSYIKYTGGMNSFLFDFLSPKYYGLHLKFLTIKTNLSAFLDVFLLCFVLLIILFFFFNWLRLILFLIEVLTYSQWKQSGPISTRIPLVFFRSNFNHKLFFLTKVMLRLLLAVFFKLWQTADCDSPVGISYSWYTVLLTANFLNSKKHIIWIIPENYIFNLSTWKEM